MCKPSLFLRFCLQRYILLLLFKIHKKSDSNNIFHGIFRATKIARASSLQFIGKTCLIVQKNWSRFSNFHFKRYDPKPKSMSSLFRCHFLLTHIPLTRKTSFHLMNSCLTHDNQPPIKLSFNCSNYKCRTNLRESAYGKLKSSLSWTMSDIRRQVMLSFYWPFWNSASVSAILSMNQWEEAWNERLTLITIYTDFLIRLLKFPIICCPNIIIECRPNASPFEFMHFLKK